MIFLDIPTGADVFLDANTLVYHFMAEPLYGAACTALMMRIETQLSPHPLREVGMPAADGDSELGVLRQLAKTPELRFKTDAQSFSHG